MFSFEEELAMEGRKVRIELSSVLIARKDWGYEVGWVFGTQGAPSTEGRRRWLGYAKLGRIKQEFNWRD